MTFITGWINSSLSEYEAGDLINKIKGNMPPYIKDKLHVKANSFVTCLASSNNIEEERNYLISVTGINSNDTSNLNSAKNFKLSLIKSYEENGEKFLSQISGGFSLILVDQEKQKIILAIDPIGQKSLYYAQTKNGLIFGSTADSIIQHPDVGNEIAFQSIYDYVYFHQCPSPNTIYSKVNKLEGGQMLIYQAGKITLKQYWMPEFREKLSGTIQQAGKELQERLIQVVKKEALTEQNTGAFLSGGLDSSSVAGALSKVYPGKAKTFTIGFPVEGYDEINYSRIASNHFKTKPHEYYLTPEDAVAAIPKIAEHYDEPFGNSSALPTYYCAKLAKENGVSRLLAGDGGDEIFAGNERYARQLLFESYLNVPGLMRAGFESIFNHLPQSLLKQNLFFKGQRYIEQANTPLPDRLQDYNFLHRHQADEIFTDGFVETVNTAAPLQALRDSYHRPKEATALNRMLYMDWKTTLHDNDLVKVNKMCEMAGVEVVYPMLDMSIINLSCQIPSADKLKNRQLRWFYKEAMNGFLPQEIINKSKHGFGLPFGIWLKEYQPLRELAYDSMHDLKKRPYFRVEFIDNVIKLHQSTHASYYGELIWILMMLEQWLQAKERK